MDFVGIICGDQFYFVRFYLFIYLFIYSFKCSRKFSQHSSSSSAHEIPWISNKSFHFHSVGFSVPFHPEIVLNLDTPSKFQSTSHYTAKHLIIQFPLLIPAMVVRFITRRFIGEYDPNLEKIYSFNTIVDNECIFFEILDTAGPLNVRFSFHLKFPFNFPFSFFATEKWLCFSGDEHSVSRCFHFAVFCDR
jgi:hypothetical protein